MEKRRVFGTGGELLVHQLVAQGVSYAFTNTGSAEAGFFNGLLTVPGVQPILLLAESLVLSAADGYAKAARKPAFVNVHLAAGTRQGSGQLQNAYFDGTPMVVTAAMRDVGSYGDHGALVASGGFSQMGAVEDITKRRWEVWDAGGIPTVTRRAFKDATTFPTGPVYVAYASQALEATNVEAVIQAAEPPHMGLAPDARVIHSIWDALLNAERPLARLRAGRRRGGRGGGAPRAGREARAARGHGHLRLRELSRPSPELRGQRRGDLRGGLGRGVLRGLPPEHARQRHRPALRPRRHHHRDRPRPVAARQHLPARHRRVGRRETGARRPSTPRGRTPTRASRISSAAAPTCARAARRGCESSTTRPHALAGNRPIHPDYLAHVAGRALPENTVLVSESFRNADHLMPFGFEKHQWRLVRTFGASLGYGIGAAVGAQLGAPDRPVVCSLGDGAVMYSASGFWTMARYGLPILTLVWNNLNYQTVRTNFHTFGGEMAKQKKYPEVFLGEPEIDFVMLAKAQGIEGSQVREPGELEAALRRGVDATRAGEPYVLDIRVATVGSGADSIWHKRFKLRQ